MYNRILIVDDEKNTLEGIARFLHSKSLETVLAENGRIALEVLKKQSVDLILTDLRMPVIGGMDLINQLKSLYPDVKILVMTAYGSVETAVEAVKRGADDFLTKPLNLDKLYLTINQLLENKILNEENLLLRQQLDEKYGLQNIIGNSEPMQKVFDVIKQVAPSRATVLIQGESGTGKELVAHAIHQLSPRRSRPFVAVHCASLSDNLLESELFGHEKGAFTGAIEQRIGRFEQADGGTLFLDEVSEISPPVQVKLLRVLQEQSFERVGGTKTIRVDIRIVTATNKKLETEVINNRFREDLFYRLNVITINLPSLRERSDDIPLLLNHFLNIFVKENNRDPMEFDSDVIKILKNYHWPGNIRELRNCIENIVVLSKQNIITIRDLPEKILASTSKDNVELDTLSERETNFPGINIKSNEKALIIKALQSTKGNRTEAAKILGLSRRTLYRKLESYGINI